MEQSASWKSYIYPHLAIKSPTLYESRSLLSRLKQFATSPNPMISDQIKTYKRNSIRWILPQYHIHAYFFESVYFLEIFPPPQKCHMCRPSLLSWLFKIMLFGGKHKSCRSLLRNFYIASRFSTLIPISFSPQNWPLWILFWLTIECKNNVHKFFVVVMCTSGSNKT